MYFTCRSTDETVVSRTGAHVMDRYIPDGIRCGTLVDIYSGNPGALRTFHGNMSGDAFYLQTQGMVSEMEESP